MPVYNADRYVTDAVESILVQTFHDFEFIIIDDGSTDGSPAILRRFAERDARIRLISRPNTGYVRALNEALGIARGQYVARMDADDVALPGRLMLQLDYLRRNPDVLCVGGAVVQIDTRNRVLAHRVQPLDDEGIQQKNLTGRTAMWHPTVMMRRRAIEVVGGYHEELEFAEDLDLWLRLGEQGKLANLPEFVLLYRVHDQSVTSLHNIRQFDHAREACERAWRRRCLKGEFVARPGRPGSDRKSRTEFFLKYARSAWALGEHRTAVVYALKGVLLRPFDGSFWGMAARAIRHGKLVRATMSVLRSPQARSGGMTDSIKRPKARTDGANEH